MGICSTKNKEQTQQLLKSSTSNYMNSSNNDEKEDDLETITSSLYTWGRNDYGQLLKDTRASEQVDKADLLVSKHEFAARKFESPVSHFAIGLFHSIATTNRGTIWGSGDNEDDQLDNTQPIDFFKCARPLRGSEALQGMKTCSVAVGLKHSAIVTKDGLVLTWGSNESGQLGHSKYGSTKVAPRQPDGNFRRERAVQVACSEGATIILTERGQVWSTGEATRGELGRPEALETRCSWMASPVLGRLFCNPVVSISAGAAHVIAITVTGKAIGWGWNRHGQLGFFPRSDVHDFEPSPLALTIPCESVRMGSCGTHHSAFLSNKGVVFTAGSNDYGQLGRGDEAFSFLAVNSILDDEIVKVSCGSFHTIALSSSGTCFGFGSNESGEIQTTVVEDEKILRPVECLDAKVLDIACGGRSSSALVSTDPNADFRKKMILRLASRPRMHELDAKTLTKLSEDALSSSSLANLQAAMGEFHATGLNWSFLFEDNQSKVDIVGVQTTLHLVWKAMTIKEDGENWIIQRYTQLHQELGDLAPVATEPDQLRAFFIGLLNPSCEQMPSACYALLVKAVASLKDESLALIAKWSVSDCGADVFEKSFLKQLVRVVDFAAEKRDWSSKGCAPSAVRILEKLYEFSMEKQGFAPFDKFYVHQPDRWSHHVVLDEWRRFVRRADQEFSLFGHPFVLSAKTKRNVMMYDQQNSQLQNAVSAALTQAGNPFFEITVRRDHILEDALSVLLRSKKCDLTKPLRVAFENEPGLDLEGVRKEFFELLSRTLFNPETSDLFCFPDPDNQPNMLWLNARGQQAKLVARAEKVHAKRRERFIKSPLGVPPSFFIPNSFSCPKKCGLKDLRSTGVYNCSVCGCRIIDDNQASYCPDCTYYICAICKSEDVVEEVEAWEKVVLVGALMGLSVYSSTLIDVHFPLALYSGLLDKPIDPRLSDLSTIDIGLTRGLQSILDFPNDEDLFKETFGNQTFYLKDVDYELIPNGKEINLTLENREFYVKRRCEFEVRDGVAPLLNAIMTGFKAVVDVHGSAMSLFSPPELELMIVGFHVA